MSLIGCCPSDVGAKGNNYHHIHCHIGINRHFTILTIENCRLCETLESVKAIIHKIISDQPRGKGTAEYGELIFWEI